MSGDVSVELPERIRSGPPCDLMRRTLSTSKSLERAPFQAFGTVGDDEFFRRIEAIRHRTARRLGPEARPVVVGAAAQQEIEALAIRGKHRIAASGGPVGCAPVAVGEVVVIAGVLDDAIQRDVFDDFEFSHLRYNMTHK